MTHAMCRCAEMSSNGSHAGLLNQIKRTCNYPNYGMVMYNNITGSPGNNL